MFLLQVHWGNMLEIVKSMEKVGKDANKVYDQVLNTSDNAVGPSKTKCRLLSELEDLHHTTLVVSRCVLSFLELLGATWIMFLGS